MVKNKAYGGSFMKFKNLRHFKRTLQIHYNLSPTLQ